MKVCLVNGKHTPGSQWERECPLRRARSRQESEKGVSRGVVAGRSGSALQPRENPGPEGEGFDGHAPSRRPEHQGRYGRKGGRPRKHANDTARQTAAKRAYRERKKQERIAASAAALTVIA